MNSNRPKFALHATIRVFASASIVAAVPIAARANLVISSGTTTNMSCSGGVCTATAKNAVLNVTMLQNMLVASSVKVATGTVTTDIDVDAAFSWVSANALTLDAFHSIVVNKPIADSGPGGLVLVASDGGKGGTLSFGANGKIAFLGTTNNLTIDGAAYTLVGNIATLASDIAANPGGDFALAGNYDARRDGTYASSPVATTFAGIFQGLGNTISNLSIDNGVTNGFVGLFAQVGPGGAIENLDMTGVSIKGSGSWAAGGLAAQNSGPGGGQPAGFLFGDSVNGTIAVVLGGASRAVPGGGLVGINAGTISNSHASATVAGGDNTIAGGLAGQNIGGTIANAYASGVVTGGQAAFVGGLVGDATSGQIDRSYATGAVTGGVQGAYVGGLLGYTDAAVGSSYATGAVTGGQNSYVGGLAGYNNSIGPGTIANCYATGRVKGSKSIVGGLLGDNVGAVSDSYSIGVVSGGLKGFIGGLMGYDGSNAGQIVHSYWDTTTSGTTKGTGNKRRDRGVTGLTNTQLQSGLPVGFKPSIWGEKSTINGGLPYLLALPPR